MIRTAKLFMAAGKVVCLVITDVGRHLTRNWTAGWHINRNRLVCWQAILDFKIKRIIAVYAAAVAVGVTVIVTIDETPSLQD